MDILVIMLSSHLLHPLGANYRGNSTHYVAANVTAEYVAPGHFFNATVNFLSLTMMCCEQFQTKHKPKPKQPD